MAYILAFKGLLLIQNLNLHNHLNVHLHVIYWACRWLKTYVCILMHLVLSYVLCWHFVIFSLCFLKLCFRMFLKLDLSWRYFSDERDSLPTKINTTLQYIFFYTVMFLSIQLLEHSGACSQNLGIKTEPSTIFGLFFKGTG